jgi:hypothetical protein
MSRTRLAIFPFGADIPGRFAGRRSKTMLAIELIWADLAQHRHVVLRVGVLCQFRIFHTPFTI